MLTGLAYVTAIAIAVAVTFGTFGTFLGGVRRFFLRPDGLPRPMRRLATIGVLLAAVGAVWTAMSPVAIGRLALANVGLAAATGLFRWARRTVKDAPLPIA